MPLRLRFASSSSPGETMRRTIQLEALQAGASGFVSKNVSVETVPRVVQRVVSGEAAISRTVTMRLIEGLRRLPEGGIGDAARAKPADLA